MKKYICLALCLCMFLFFVGCKSETNNPADEDTDLATGISDTVDFKVTDDNLKVWLDNSHIKNISLDSDEEGGKTLIFTTTEEGKSLLYNATNENIGSQLWGFVDNNLIISPTVMAPIEDGVFTFNSTHIDHVYLYNYLANAKDKMKDVVPPKTLISEEDVKNKVFERANTSADNVTDINIKLKIDQKTFGWKYCIDFDSNGKQYTSEVNAHDGLIIKFDF